MIKNEDLIPGGIYECAGDLFKFLWLNVVDHPVFEPLNDDAKKYYNAYDENSEKADPKCKKGMIGFKTAEYMKFIGMVKDV